MKERYEVKIKQRIIVIVLIIAMVVSIMPTTAIAAEGSDNVYNLLKNISASVYQGNDSGGWDEVKDFNLKHDKNIKIMYSFDVPVKGDDESGEPQENTYVKGGDKAVFKLPEALKLVNNKKLNLMFGETKIGVAEFKNDSVEVTFDTILDDEGISKVHASFEAYMDYDPSGDAALPGEHPITILDKTYKVVISEEKTFISGDKSGTIDFANNVVEWKVKVSALKESGTEADLDGYVFCDDITEVGEYVSDSFTVSSDEGSLGTVPDTGFNFDKNVLYYTFPDNTKGTRWVNFKTKVPDGKLQSTGKQTITNTAKINKDGLEVKALDGGVEFNAEWISKSGAVVPGTEGTSDRYDAANRQISWEIVVNHMGVSVNDAVVEDALPEGLELVSGSAYYEIRQDDKWTGKTSITPVISGEKLDFNLGNISSKVRITFVTKVSDVTEAYKRIEYSNSANLTGSNLKAGGFNSNTAKVGIGINPITKKGNGYTRQNHQMDWTVSVDTKGQTYGGNLRILDLLVYGDKAITMNDITITDGTGAENNSIVSKDDISKVKTQSLNQKYVEGSFHGEGLNLTKYTINKDGKAVADLLVVTGAHGAGLNTDAISTYSYKTVVTNPDIYAGNNSKNVGNTAYLFAADKSINYSTANVWVTSSMLRKDMMSITSAENPDANKNSTPAKPEDGFDYNNMAAVFRIHVNADNLSDATEDITADPDKAPGDITASDVLPMGWEFKDIEPGKKFIIYKAASNGDKVIAGERIDDYSSFMEEPVIGSATDISGEAMSFTFKKLDKPYMILVKAGPTEETQKEYFGSNGVYNLSNRVELKAENISMSQLSNNSQNVKITSDVLGKKIDKSKADLDGYLKWTVDINSYGVLQNMGAEDEAYIEDTLTDGIEFRRDSKGKILIQENNKGTISNNFEAYELIMNADGSVTQGESIKLEEGKNISYSSDTRTLKFIVPDCKKAYRLQYITDITGYIGNVKNTVRLSVGDKSEAVTPEAYKISEAASAASLTRSGWISITKQDKTSGTPLAGAEFQLLSVNTDNDSNFSPAVIRKGTTDDKGVLKLRGIPQGDYILKETAAPAEHLLSGKEYKVSVMENDDGTVTTTIDGKSGSSSNNITVTNIKNDEIGSLTISKTVDGNSGDKTKKFALKVELSDKDSTYQYTGNGVADGTIKSGDSIMLAHGQSITIKDIPQDTSYSVEEEDYSSDGYVLSKSGNTGVILKGENKEAKFINTKNIYPKAAKVSFTAKKTFDGETPAGTHYEFYLKDSKGVILQTKQSVDGVITFDELQYNTVGEHIYTISEKPGEDDNINYDKTIYTVKVNIIKAVDYEAKVVYEKDGKEYDGVPVFNNNTRTGELIIKNTVDGNAGDKTKKFAFKVELSDKSSTYEYTGNGIPDGTIKSGDIIELAHGQSITIKGIRQGVRYRITQYDYSSDGYVTSKTGYMGTIAGDKVENAEFLDTKNVEVKPDILPQTGDSSIIDMWIIMALFVVDAIILTIYIKRHKKI